MYEVACPQTAHWMLEISHSVSSICRSSRAITESLSRWDFLSCPSLFKFSEFFGYPWSAMTNLRHCGKMIFLKVFGIPLQGGETRKKVTEGSARKYFEFLKNSKCQKERFAFCHTCLLRPVCGVAHCKILGFCTVPTFDDGHVVEPLHVWSSSTGASAH